jgi:hypothetical protein
MIKYSWASFGIGSKMENADFYVGWKNSKGDYVISRRAANGYKMPTFATTQLIKNVPLEVPSPSWANLAFSFSRPIEAENKIESTSSFIYGYSNDAPSQIDSPQSNFGIHESYGALPKVDFLSLTGSRGAGVGSGKAFLKSTREQKQKVLLAHGSLFFIAWFLAPLAAIFIARYLKDLLGIWWYRIHWGMMAFITGGFTTIAFILVLLYRNMHFDDPHSVMSYFCYRRFLIFHNSY